MDKYAMFMDWKNQDCENDYTTQGNLLIQCNPYQVTNASFFGRFRKKYQNLYGNTKDPKHPKQF